MLYALCDWKTIVPCATPSTRACVLLSEGEEVSLCPVLYTIHFFPFRTGTVDVNALKWKPDETELFSPTAYFARVCFTVHVYRVMCYLFSLSRYLSLSAADYRVCESLSPHWKLVARTSLPNKIILLTYHARPARYVGNWQLLTVLNIIIYRYTVYIQII